MAQLIAHRIWDAGAASLSLATPTNILTESRGFVPAFGQFFVCFQVLRRHFKEIDIYYAHLSNEVYENYFSLITAAQILTAYKSRLPWILSPWRFA